MRDRPNWQAIMRMTQLQHEKRIYAARRGDRFPPNQKQPWEGYVHEALVDTCGRSVDRRGRNSISSVASGQGDGSITLLDSSKTSDWTEVGKANSAMKDGALVADKLDDARFFPNSSADSYKDFRSRRSSGPTRRPIAAFSSAVTSGTRSTPRSAMRSTSSTSGRTRAMAPVRSSTLPRLIRCRKRRANGIPTRSPRKARISSSGQRPEDELDVQDSKHNAGGPFALQYESAVLWLRQGADQVALIKPVRGRLGSIGPLVFSG